MQQDELIWQIINHGHCSFKTKVAEQSTFCRNEYNITGLCNRSSCPLANSNYATVREEGGRIFLCIKTVERAHTPKKLWEKIKLPRNYMEALTLLDQNLQHWPKFQVHKIKQRLTKIHQYLIRMRKLAKKTKRKKVRINHQVEQRDSRREQKALRAAGLEATIEKELLARLRQGTYGDIYNFPEQEYNKALDSAANKMEKEEEEEEEEGAREAEEFEAADSDEDDEDDIDFGQDVMDWASGAGVFDGDSDDDDDDEDDDDDDDDDEEEDDDDDADDDGMPTAPGSPEDGVPQPRSALRASDSAAAAAAAPRGVRFAEDSPAAAAGAGSSADAAAARRAARKQARRAKKARRQGPRVEIEYEDEEADAAERIALTNDW